MVPKIGAQYIGKRIMNTIMAPPAEPAEAESGADTRTSEPRQAAAAPPPLSGQIINDDSGQPLGKARAVLGLAVYVIDTGRGNAAEQLERCVADPNAQIFLHREDGKITGLIYAPDPAQIPPPAEATRSDDV